MLRENGEIFARVGKVIRKYERMEEYRKIKERTMEESI